MALDGALRAMLGARSVALVGASPKFDTPGNYMVQSAHSRRLLRPEGGRQPQIRRGRGPRLLSFAPGAAVRPRPRVARGGQPPAGGTDGGGGKMWRAGRRRVRERARGPAARPSAHRAVETHRGRGGNGRLRRQLHGVCRRRAGLAGPGLRGAGGPGAGERGLDLPFRLGLLGTLARGEGHPLQPRRLHGPGALGHHGRLHALRPRARFDACDLPVPGDHQGPGPLQAGARHRRANATCR